MAPERLPSAACADSRLAAWWRRLSPTAKVRSSPTRARRRSKLEIKGKRISLPRTEYSVHGARFCTAELREHGVKGQCRDCRHHREQGAVAYALPKAFSVADYGGIAPYSGVMVVGEEGRRLRLKSRSPTCR